MYHIPIPFAMHSRVWNFKDCWALLELYMKKSLLEQQMRRWLEK